MYPNNSLVWETVTVPNVQQRFADIERFCRDTLYKFSSQIYLVSPDGQPVTLFFTLFDYRLRQ